jgi:nuclear GTP-binding protein
VARVPWQCCTPADTTPRGENFYRDAKQARRVKLLSKEGIASKPIRNAKGDVTQTQEFQSREVVPGRVQPDRRWFGEWLGLRVYACAAHLFRAGNTRVISQDALDHFRESLGARTDDPYSVLLRRNKLPMSLIQDAKAGPAPKLTAVESFASTFGPGAQRKRPRLDAGAAGSFAELAETSAAAGAAAEAKDEDARQKARGAHLVVEGAEIGVGPDGLPVETHVAPASGLGTDEVWSAPVTRGRSEPIYSKGQSRRIWGELYKVIDSSDVVIHVLDVRDPLGTRCKSVIKHIREEKPHKHLVFLLNKVDLVPTWVTVSARWACARRACVSRFRPVFPITCSDRPVPAAMPPHSHVKARTRSPWCETVTSVGD